MGRLNRNNLKRGLSYFKRNGFRNSYYKAIERLHRDEDEAGYSEKVIASRLSEAELSALRNKQYQNPVKISILIPAYETDPELFLKTLESVARQTYGNWELIIGDASKDDSRKAIVNDFVRKWDKFCSDQYADIRDKVVYKHLSENKGISGNTNACLQMATGDYIALLDHDDVIEDNLLSEYMKEIEYASLRSENGEKRLNKVMVCYCDEDKVTSDDLRYFDWHRKPDFDPILLLTNNYICHFLMVDTSLARSVNGFDSDYDGAQDHDFILKVTRNLRDDEVVHVPKALYHWRSTISSTSENPSAKLYAYKAGKRAVEAFLQRKGLKASVKDTAHLGFYRFDLESQIERSQIKELSGQEWSKLSIEDIRAFKEEFIMIKSDKLSPLRDDYSRLMAQYFWFDRVGAVTGKITRKNNRIESAGYDKIEGGLVPRFNGLNKNYSGYLHRASLQQYVDGFTEELVMLRKNAIADISNGISLDPGYKIVYEPEAIFIRKDNE